jgi:hypothetical protein
MIKSALAITSVGLILLASSVASWRNAYAHNFTGDESASFLAKVQELKVETHLIQRDLANKTLVVWHIDKTGEFWNVNDIKEMEERNQRLSKEIPAGLSNLTTAANSTNPDAAKVKQIVDGLDNSLAEAVAARIDPTALNNATVNALAVKAVLDETIEDYGIAVGASNEGNNSSLSSENGTVMMSSSNNSMPSSSTTTPSNKSMSSMNASNSGNKNNTGGGGQPIPIVNAAAYQTAQGLATSAQGMYNDLKTKMPSNNTAAITNLDQGFTKLIKAIDNKMSNDDVMAIVHGTIHPNLETAYDLQVVPEFPLPILAAIIGIGGVVAYSRMKTRRFL